uniref:Uncharacterized protein n=1 Tax=Chroomonas mesostigmatica CCMP1168 TaxID=1195612 RepID=A0A248SPM2_9CRYP|nr:hypothetical protein CMESOPL_061 [Chroomonas mesostigmatica CCMP1168]
MSTIVSIKNLFSKVSIRYCSFTMFYIKSLFDKILDHNFTFPKGFLFLCKISFYLFLI